ncbi:acidic mammalian chitinase-like [Belonocnema kinseyi]|uniref:acidic mammalian chitinase-like n=1 Tax=Belonocnema kinseyi TaxID=2817044 RepID=UPI00143DB65F|nr:acidic mammalian chitinase-like [Belonocnema kinseyi]
MNVPQNHQTALLIHDIDLSLCTHLYYRYVAINSNASIDSVDAHADIEYGGLKKFNDLRKKKGSIQIILAVSFSFPATESVNNKLYTDQNLRQKLVNNLVKYVKKYGFNGIDLDLSYNPQHGGHPSSYKKKYVLLLKAIRERFHKERLTLSVAVDPNESTAEILYDIKEISRYVKFINLKTFEFHLNSDADKKVGVGHTSPMYHSPKENTEERKRNIDYVVRYWIRKGAPENKLILGTYFSGISYTLANPKQFGRGSPFTTEGQFGSMMTYFEFCDQIKKWKYFFDHEQKVPYKHKDNQVIAYDDDRSLEIKAKYVLDMQLGGAMVYSIDADDFPGKCGKKFALLKTLNRVLRKKC